MLRPAACEMSNFVSVISLYTISKQNPSDLTYRRYGDRDPYRADSTLAASPQAFSSTYAVLAAVVRSSLNSALG